MGRSGIEASSDGSSTWVTCLEEFKMSKFVVIVFPSETQAYEGTRALKALHAEGSLTLYSLAVVVKDPAGQLAIKDTADKGPLGLPVGALVGGLAGIVAGPVGMLVGSSGGALIGSLFDIANYGVKIGRASCR